MKFGIISAFVCVNKGFDVHQFSKYLCLAADVNRKKKPLSQGAFFSFNLNYSITRLSLLVSLVSLGDPF
jgi:hypothetical protein